MGAELLLMIPALKDLLNWVQRNREHKDEQMDAALQAINEALFESKKYVLLQQQTGESDRVEELRLSKLWNDASAKVRHVSEALAVRLRDKSQYWDRDVKWSREEVLLKRIDFEAVQHELTQLLKK